MRTLQYKVNKEDEGQTLSYIFKNKLMLSGYLIRRNKHIYNAVTINDQHADVCTIVHENDIVSVLLSDVERKSNVYPMPGPLNIIYEDEDIIVLNKRAHDIVHPDHSHLCNTLGNYLLDYYIKNNDPADFHPIQRLDNGTSGLIIFAKHTYAQNVLSKAIHTNSLTRNYIALCEGLFEQSSGTINLPVGRLNDNSIKRIIDETGQKAVTHYTVLKSYKKMSMVKLTLETGRTHQIRVHLSHIGHPLIGDQLYGGVCTQYLDRPALHSYEALFVHPVTGNLLHLYAPLPDDIDSQIKHFSG